jgi:membrane-associated phospholipid phosphatase
MAKKRNTAKAAIDTIETIDLEAAEAVRELGAHPVAKGVTLVAELADQPPMIAISAATLIAGVWRRDDRMTRAGGRMLAAHLLATTMKAVVKRAVDRTRPAVAAERGYRRGRGRDNSGPLNSFPSGHTAGALAVARAASRDYPDTTLPGAAFVATVALAQTPGGKHYPSDVAAGAVIGVIAEALVNAVWTAASATTARPARR